MTPQGVTDITSQAGSKVVLQAVVAEATKGQLEAFEGAVEKGMLSDEAMGTLAKGVSAVMDVIEAAETGAAHDAMVEELNQLESEVRNPENIEDRGSFTFTVNADGSLEGEGSGRYSQTQVSADSRGVGGTNYRFSVGGASAPELAFWLTPEGADPGSFKVIITTTAGQVLTVPGAVNNGPMLFSQDDLRLKRGTTVRYNVRGPGMTDIRSISLR